MLINNDDLKVGAVFISKDCFHSKYKIGEIRHLGFPYIKEIPDHKLVLIRMDSGVVEYFTTNNELLNYLNTWNYICEKEWLKSKEGILRKIFYKFLLFINLKCDTYILSNNY